MTSGFSYYPSRNGSTYDLGGTDRVAVLPKDRGPGVDFDAGDLLSTVAATGGGRKAGDLGLAAIKQGLINAGKSPAAFIGKHGGKLAGLGILTAILGGAAELTDSNDTLATNAAEGVGFTTGTLGGMAAGAAAGAALTGPLAPVGALAGAAIVGALGGSAGKGLLGTVANAIQGISPEDRELNQRLRGARAEGRLRLEQTQESLPVMEQYLAVKRDDDIRRLGSQVSATNDVNFANALNAMIANRSNQNDMQMRELNRGLFG
jgi:hypothetical protein